MSCDKPKSGAPSTKCKDKKSHVYVKTQQIQWTDWQLSNQGEE